jgi:hypothetical protein
MSQLQSPLFRTLIAMTMALLVAGCKSSGNEPIPQPSPSPAAASVLRTIDGHTEIHTGTGATTLATDDGDHCFKQEDTRDLVLTVNAPEITKDNQPTPFLIDIFNGPVKDPPHVDFVKDGTATITYHGHARERNARSRLALPMHLGPGPYVAVAAMAQPMASGTKSLISGSQPILLAYPYVTYGSDQKECPTTGSQR